MPHSASRICRLKVTVHAKALVLEMMTLSEGSLTVEAYNAMASAGFV